MRAISQAVDYKSRWIFAFTLCVLTFGAYAEDVVTFSEPTRNPATQKAYIKDIWEDEAYVTLRATVDNPLGQSCITPTGRTGVGSFFSTRTLEVVIGVQLIGFQGVDSTQEIPIAIYNWQGDRYCNSSWKHPVLLAPAVPTRSANVISGASPEIVLHVRSVTREEERLSVVAQALLGIASTYATGTGVDVVASLTNLATGPAVKFLSNEYNARAKNSSAQTFRIPFPWIGQQVRPGAIDGLESIQTRLLRSPIAANWVRDIETVEQAVQRTRTAKSGVSELLTLNINVDIRRSVFVTDSQLSQAYLPPANSPYTTTSAILNFPRKGSATPFLPTINQSLNQYAPSFAAGLRERSLSECDRLITHLVDSGFNRVDRALITVAVLNDARPGWRSEPDFYNPCLENDPPARKAIEAIYGKLREPAPGTVFKNAELSPQLEAFWRSSFTTFLATLRRALFSSEQIRATQLPAALSNVSASSVGWPEKLTAVPNAQTAADYLRAVPVTQAGCLFGYRDEAGAPHMAMVVVAQDRSSNLAPHLLVARIASPVQDEARLEWVGLFDLMGPDGPSYRKMIVDQNFGPGSLCHIDPTATDKGGQLLGQLSKRSSP